MRTLLSLLFLLKILVPGFAASLHSQSDQQQTQEVFLDASSAHRFLGRKILYNHWDFELIVPDNLERECIEEVCSYEEAREVFEDNLKTAEYGEWERPWTGLGWPLTCHKKRTCPPKQKKFWETYPHNGRGGARTPGVDVAGLVSGLIAALVSIVMFIVVAMYCVKYRAKERNRSRRLQENLYPGIPLANLDDEPKPESAPGLPSYEQAMASPGVHDAPPPPYNRDNPHPLYGDCRNNTDLTPPT